MNFYRLIGSLFIAFCVLIPLKAQATLWIASEQPPLVIGALLSSDLEEIASQEAILLDRLRREFYPRTVQMQYYDRTGLLNALKSKSIDFFISDAAFFASVEHTEGTSALAGLVLPEAVDVEHMSAAVLFVNNNSSSIKNIQSAKGATAIYLQKDSFSGDLIVQHFLKKKGYSPDQFWGKLSFSDGTVEKVLQRVQSDAGVVGVLPACMLERLFKEHRLKTEDIRVLEGQRNGGLNCLHTTGTYPGWVLASKSNGEPLLQRRLVSVALGAPSSGALEWTLPPNDFKTVHNMLIDMRVGPYQGLSRWLISDIFERYRFVFLSLLVLGVAIMLHGVLAARLVRARTKELKSAMLQQQKLAEEMMDARYRIQTMEKIQSISQLSCLFAHELKQPLGAIKNFSLGLLNFASADEMNTAMLKETLRDIIEQTDRASNIVNHVRQYAQDRRSERKVEDLGKIVDVAVKTFEKSAERKIDINFSTETQPVLVEVNSWEIQLVILNLMKNADDALQEIAHPKIEVSVLSDELTARVRVQDNGNQVTEASVERMFEPWYSTKSSGLGLGLSIVISVAESHGGRIAAEKNSGGGLTVDLVLPLIENKRYD